jgi:hypothetical protein
MQNSFLPDVFPGSVTGQVDSYIKQIFTSHSSNNVALIDLTWYFRHSDNIVEFIKQNQDKHLLLLSATDPFYFRPRRAPEELQHEAPHCDVSKHILSHTAGYTPIGNVWNKNYFSFWLEFMRQHHEGRFEFDYNTVDISKVFMCLNRKPHSHRIKLVKHIYDANLQHDGYISLGHRPDRENFSLPTPILLDNDIVNEEGNAAGSTSKHDNISCDITSLGHTDNWQSFFVNVVTETSLGMMDFVSEKTLKPILGYKPFIIMGPSPIYDILHSWGIDTFDDIFGCDYTDLLVDRGRDQRGYIDNRAAQIVAVINDLKKQDLNLLYKSLLPRLIENRKALLNAMEENHKYIITLAKQF